MSEQKIVADGVTVSTFSGSKPAPRLSVGDEVSVAQYPGDRFTVVGFRADGMLVDCIRHADCQEFCVPRFQSPGGWLIADHKGQIS